MSVFLQTLGVVALHVGTWRRIEDLSHSTPGVSNNFSPIIEITMASRQISVRKSTRQRRILTTSVYIILCFTFDTLQLTAHYNELFSAICIKYYWEKCQVQYSSTRLMRVEQCALIKTTNYICTFHPALTYLQPMESSE